MPQDRTTQASPTRQVFFKSSELREADYWLGLEKQGYYQVNGKSSGSFCVRHGG